MPSTTEVIKFSFIFHIFIKKKKVQHNYYYKNKIFTKNQLDDQHCNASESRDNFKISARNQKHSKLSTHTYGFTHHVFTWGIYWNKLDKNLVEHEIKVLT